jgi:hypothetical protein
LTRGELSFNVKTMSITGIVEHDTIKLSVHVPDGTRVEIVLPAEAGSTEALLAMPVTDDLFYGLSELAEPMGRLTNEEIDTVIYGG